MMENPFEAASERNDVIEHPAHYCRDGAIESIDEMEMIFGGRAVMDFCMLNAWKYRYRAADKNGSQDIAKSDWYMRKFRELKQKYGFTCNHEILNGDTCDYSFLNAYKGADTNDGQ